MTTLPQRRNEKKRHNQRQARPYRGKPLLKGYENGRPGIEETCDDPLAGLSYEEWMMAVAMQREGIELKAGRLSNTNRISPIPAISLSDRNESYDEDDVDFDDSQCDF